MIKFKVKTLGILLLFFSTIHANEYSLKYSIDNKTNENAIIKSSIMYLEDDQIFTEPIKTVEKNKEISFLFESSEPKKIIINSIYLEESKTKCNQEENNNTFLITNTVKKEDYEIKESLQYKITITNIDNICTYSINS